jgi:hypothetical protein
VTAPPSPATDRAAPALRAIVADLRREARRRRIAVALAACAAFALPVALAHHREASHGEAALAVGLAAASPCPARALALAAGGPGATEAALGVECAATELCGAAVVVAAGWLALRGGTTSLGAWAAASSAAAGAVAVAAALQLTCPARGALAHLLAFHVAGVLVAAAAAAMLLRAACGARSRDRRGGPPDPRSRSRGG